MEGDRHRKRSMSDPSDMFQMDKEVKKSGGISHFFHKLPFLLGRHHRHHGHSHSDDEFCDIEDEIKKAEKQKSRSNGHKIDRKETMHEESSKQEEAEEEHKVVVMVNDSTDTELDHEKEKVKSGERDSEETGSVETNNDRPYQHENGSGDSNNVNEVCTSANDLKKDDENISDDQEEEPLHEPPMSPLPPPTKSCLKHTSCSLGSDVVSKPFQMRKRSISVPEGDLNIIFRLNRHVHFSPDTVEPTPRNCKYREWIEKHSSHSCVKANLKHEKRMQQLRQIHSLDINDYLSKSHQRYHRALNLASPMPSLGCDIFM